MAWALRHYDVANNTRYFRQMSKFTSGTMKLVASQAVVIGIGFGTAPIISRLFYPREFGIVGMIEAIAAWLAAFGCLSYAQAIPLSSGKSESRSLIRLCLLITAGLLVPIFCFFLFGGGILSSALTEPALGQYVWFIPLLFLLDTLSKIRRYTLSLEGRYGLLSISNFASSNISRSIQILLGFFLGGSAGYLLLGGVVGGIVSVIIGSTAIIPLVFGKTESNEHTVLNVAKKHSQFPRAQMWNTVLLVSSASVPVLLLGYWFDASTVGQYSFARKMLELPIQILGVSVAQTFYPEVAAEWNQKGTMSATVGSALRMLSIALIFPIVMIGLLGPFLFQFILGSNWHEAGVFSQILSPWFLVIAISSPLSTVFLVRKRAKELLLYSVILVISRPMAIAAGHLLDSPRAAVLFMSVIGTTLFLVQLRRAMHLSNLSSMQAFGPMFRQTLSAALFVLPAVLVHNFFHIPTITLGLLIAGTAGYVWLVFKREPAVSAKLKSITSRWFPAKKVTKESDCGC